MSEEIKIWAPLINGESWLRNLGIPGLKGPYSSSYGGRLYATIRRKDAVAAFKKARGYRRALIKEVCKL
jgi:hypothetical protein